MRKKKFFSVSDYKREKNKKRNIRKECSIKFKEDLSNLDREVRLRTL